tara:strand:- start:125 stop:349 length:225 start_codon:yes stop_codon:yes gene_type:complete
MYKPNLDVTLLSSKTVQKIVSVVDELKDAIPNTKENYELREKANYIIHKTEKVNKTRQGIKRYHESNRQNGEQL